MPDQADSIEDVLLWVAGQGRMHLVPKAAAQIKAICNKQVVLAVEKYKKEHE